MQTATELDEIDLRILEVLQQEGRLSNRELSERVFLSPSQCLRRTKRLEQSGVIRGYAALLNPGRIGLGVRAFVNVSLEKHGQDPAAGRQCALQPAASGVQAHHGAPAQPPAGATVNQRKDSSSG